MTPEERRNPDLMSPSRKKRIAKGCGRDITEINMFLKQFEQMRKMMYQMSKSGMMGGGGMNPAMAGGGAPVAQRGDNKVKKKKRRF